MFLESWPWKRDLAASADRLEAARLGLARQLDGDEDSEESAEALYQVERDVMAGAFAARRLLGMPSKVTKAARATLAVVIRLPLRDVAKPPDLWDRRFGYFDIYDLNEPKTATISANELCNLFIHSLIFQLAWTIENLAWADYCSLSENDPRLEAEPLELAGLLVATDKSSTDHLAFVSLAEIVRVFRVLADDEVTQVIGSRDRKGRMHLTAT